MAKNNKNLENNILLKSSTAPYKAPPFGLFNMEDVAPAIEHALVVSRANINDIVNNEDTPSFTNTIHRLAFNDELLESVYAPFGEATSAKNTKEVQETKAVVMPLLISYRTETVLNKKLFERIKYVYDHADKASLSEEEQTLLEKTYQGFANEGALLKGKKREKYVALSQKLAKLTTDFSDNIVNDTAGKRIIIKAADKDRLKGIPKDTIAMYQQKAAEAAAKNETGISKDDYIIPMSPPPIALLTYGQDRSLREEAAILFGNLASAGEYDNTQNVHDILETRHQIAQLLGFKNHADKTIRQDTRMAQNAETAWNFVNKNRDMYLPQAKKFIDELKDFAKDRDGITDLKPWDQAYYTRLMKEEKIGLNEEELRDYFELENVLDGMFKHAEKLYGIKVQEVQNTYPTLHSDVRTYEILDAKSGDIKALYYLDPFARDYKKSGAWMNNTRSAGLHNGQREIPIATNYCNFTKPAKDHPALLTLGEVTTLFHEFGHGLHGMMGEGIYPSLSGTNTAWDYVELPSQINECWALKPSVLKTYARHHETGKLMPKKLMDKLEQAEKFGSAAQGLRQTSFGLLDLATYMTDPADIKDLKVFEDNLLEDINLIKGHENTPPKALTFGHIISGGYSAGYYSYKWADALVADVFEQFEEQGLYKKSLCTAFRDCMIKPGGAKNPSEMHKDFMEAAGQGRRALDAEAMFRAEGILPAKSKKPKAP